MRASVAAIAIGAADMIPDVANAFTGRNGVKLRSSDTPSSALRVKRFNQVEQAAFDHLVPLAGNKHKALTVLCATYMHGAPPMMKISMAGAAQTIASEVAMLRRTFRNVPEAQAIAARIEKQVMKLGAMMDIWPTSSRGVIQQVVMPKHQSSGE